MNIRKEGIQRLSQINMKIIQYKKQMICPSISIKSNGQRLIKFCKYHRKLNLSEEYFH